MDLQLNEQTVIVGGGGRGIGLAISEAFAGEQAKVAIFDIAADVEQAAQDLAGRLRARVQGWRVDATDYSAVQNAADTINEQLGRPRHVVFAAGVGSGKYGFPFWNLHPDDWSRVLAVNLLGAVHTAHALAPYLVEDRAGTMTFLSSVAGQIGSPTDPPYSAAKAAIINFAQCAARDLAPYNVRVNVICPGMVKTDLNRSVWQAWSEQQSPDERLSYDQWAEEKIRRICPLGRWQTPEDVAAAAVFLASDKAENITGQTINVDGGQVMHS